MAGASPLFIKFLGDWSSDAYMVYLVLNPAQKLSVAKTLASHVLSAARQGQSQYPSITDSDQTDLV